MTDPGHSPSFWQRARRWVALTDGQPTGRTFAHFRLDRPLGRGAVGQLHAAWDPRHQRAVALKLLASDPGSDPDTRDERRRRFIEEGRLASALRHEHIVQVLEAGEHQGQLYLVMELVPGVDLTRYTRPARLLPEAPVLRIVAQVASALAHAHDQGVLHRDIKPANVIVDLAREHAKVGDFGIARAAELERSRSGLLLGTPAYMSPEQAAGGTLDGRSDLYALGVMAYQLLTGRLPYEGDSMGQLLAQIALGDPTPLSALRPDLPPALSALVARLLSKSPKDRPTVAGEVAAAFEAFAAQCLPPPLDPGCAASAAPGRSVEAGHNRPS